MQTFDFINYLYICVIFRFIQSEVLNESLSLLSSKFNNYLTTNRKARSHVDSINQLKLFDMKDFPENFAEIPISKIEVKAENASAIMREKSDVQGLSAKLDALSNSNGLISPIADINKLKLNMEYLFSYARNSLSTKIDIQHHIINAFKMNNMQTFTHKFITEFPELEGLNIIGIRPGKYRSSDKDRILLIGAHYDSVANTSGVNDNGSGMSALLEIIRLIDSHNCQLLYTLMFVAFDLEEYGGLGSKLFVEEILIDELLTNKCHFEGAIILDTILNFNKTSGSQDIPYDIHKAIPKWSQQIKVNGFVGDFLALISRNNIDSKLAHHISNSWSSISRQTIYKLSELSVSLSAKIPDFNTLSNHANLLRSDHIMFWYPNTTLYNETLNAVLLTDTGPFRGYMRSCYHMPCDNTSHINEDNLRFLQITVEALTRTAVHLSSAKCSEHPLDYIKSSKIDNNLSSISYIAFLSYTVFVSFLQN